MRRFAARSVANERRLDDVVAPSGDDLLDQNPCLGPFNANDAASF